MLSASCGRASGRVFGWCDAPGMRFQWALWPNGLCAQEHHMHGLAAGATPGRPVLLGWQWTAPCADVAPAAAGRPRRCWDAGLRKSRCPGSKGRLQECGWDGSRNEARWETGRPAPDPARLRALYFYLDRRIHSHEASSTYHARGCGKLRGSVPLRHRKAHGHSTGSA